MPTRKGPRASSHWLPGRGRAASGWSTLGAGRAQDRRHLGVAYGLSVRQRLLALAVGEVDVHAGFDQLPHDLCVRVVPAAEDDRLEKCGPAEPVHVVDVDVGLEQSLDDRRIAAV